MSSLTFSIEAAVQQAVVTALAGDQDLAALGVRIFDRVPKNAGLPYVSIANLTSTFEDRGTDAGFEGRLTLNLWSNKQGRLEAAHILEGVRKRVGTSNLAVADYRLVNLQEEFAEIVETRDRRYVRGTIRFRFVIDV